MTSCLAGYRGRREPTSPTSDYWGFNWSLCVQKPCYVACSSSTISCQNSGWNPWTEIEDRFRSRIVVAVFKVNYRNGKYLVFFLTMFLNICFISNDRRHHKKNGSSSSVWAKMPLIFIWNSVWDIDKSWLIGIVEMQLLHILTALQEELAKFQYKDVFLTTMYMLHEVQHTILSSFSPKEFSSTRNLTDPSAKCNRQTQLMQIL